MKIKIINFGPIKEFEFDFSKKLIVTYGDNNIGKSYAMQVAYLLLKAFMNIPIDEKKMTQVLLDLYHSISNVNSITGNESILAEKQEEYKSGIDMYKEISDFIIPQFINSCRNTFGNFDLILSKNPHIYFTVRQHSMDIDIKGGTITGRTDNDYREGQSKPIAFGFAEYLYKINPILNDIVLGIQNEVGQVHFLPASRSGIYSGMNAFGAIVAELSKNRSALTKKIELPGISEPVADYFIALSGIPNYGAYTSETMDERIKECCNIIENSILKGRVIIDKNKNTLMYAPEGMEVQYSLTEVSSMVSEISPIVAFLKYVLVNKDSNYIDNNGILFIEEPEAHLHPNNQLKLMEVFAELAQAGITIVMSSHSNYVFNKLNNLVLSGKLDYNMYEPILLEKGTEGSASKPMHIDECGADDENFIDVSEALYNEREQIIEKLNEGVE